MIKTEINKKKIIKYKIYQIDSLYIVYRISYYFFGKKIMINYCFLLQTFAF